MVKVEATPDMEADLFSVFDEAAAIMAFVFRKFGGEALKMVLAEVAEADQEFLEAQAATLKALGLSEVATIVLEAAASALPAHVMHCPYAETDIHNYESWQASYQRKAANSRHLK